MASIKCGRCRNYHPSIQAVRDCFNGQAVEVVDVPQQSKADGPTDKQWNFLASLREQLGLPALPDDHREQFTRRSISQAINDHKADLDAHPELKARNKQGKHGGSKVIRADEYPAVTAGYYAVPSLTGNNDLDFFTVDAPQDGNWKGCLFAKRIVGGEGAPTRVAVTTARQWLDSLKDEADALRAKMLFGQKIGKCGECGRTLTDETSRELGIGPVCRDKK